MLPKQSTFPQFVPDQLLTNEHLNNLFNYLEEQGRLSRTNLIGIGIVCGLEVQSDGASVTIGKGVGVTSQGYLVVVDEKKYTHIKAFDAVKARIYDRFVSNSSTQLFPIDELKQAAVEEGTTAITAAYLKGKVVLIFVELLEEGAKNCNPNSCDDKGVNVTVTFRPLIVSESDAAKLNAAVTGNNSGVEQYLSLSEIKMKRFDVVATNILDTVDIFEAYQKILTSGFLTKAQQTFTQAYNTLSPLVFDAYNSNPFNDFASQFSFLHDGSISDDQLINMQYYYDLFSDMLLAYEELRRKALEMISLCAPDDQLFPRHLLLGPADNKGGSIGLPFRQYFIPSPLFQCHSHTIHELRWLFRRLVLMMDKFFVPPPLFSSKIRRLGDDKIRITPSKLGDVFISQKSIPYYYKVTDGIEKLYQNWNFEKARANASNRILSYHASLYNTTDDFVTKPLEYDIEPYNFFRIEGHIGKPYTHALQNILATRNNNRLPFEVIALSADIKNIRLQLAAIINGNATDVIDDLRQNNETSKCHFQDLESLYDTLAANLTCILCKEAQYYYAFPGSSSTLPPPNSLIPQVPLLQKCAPSFRFVANTLGHEFELFYQSFKNQPYVSADIWIANFQNPNTGTNNSTNNIGLILLYYIVKLSETIADDLSSFKLAEFVKRYDDMVKVAEFIKKLLQGIKLGDNNSPLVAFEDVIDHLDALIYACKKAAFETLVKDYRLRWVYVLVLQRFGYFIKFHPGIQHKAGVPSGGTFILVYHEEEVDVRPTTNLTTGFTRGPSNFTNENVGDTEAVNTTGKVNSINTNATAIQINAGSIKGFQSSAQVKALQDLFINRDVQNRTLDDLVSDIADGTVIADFYLPYICCSDCPPIQFIVNQREPTDPPTINIDAKEYCNDDRTEYQIATSPGGGTVTGEGVQKNATGANVFVPSTVNLNQQQSKKVVLTYELNGQKATVEVTVFQKPSAAFEFRASAASPTVIQFQNFSQFAQTFTWEFGDGSTSTEKDPAHDYKQPGNFTATLKAVNGPCSATATQQVSIEQLSILVEPNQLCSDDKKSYEVKVDPTGGDVSGEGTSKTTAGKFVFKPATVNLSNAKSKEVTITYTKGSQSKNTSVTVFQKPTAAFQFATSPASLTVIQFNNFSQFVEKFEWDFGDGEKSDQEKPQHDYKKEGTYQATLNVTNGVCSASSTQTITIEPPAPSKNCLPLGAIVDDFNKLQTIDAANFAAFKKANTSYAQIEELFKQVSGIVSQSVDKQIDFFANVSFTDPATGAKLSLPQSMVNWLNSLFGNFILEQEKFRLLALMLYRVLVDLAMYIECIQSEDLGKAKVDMSSVLELVVKHLNTLSQFITNFSAAQKAILKRLLNDVTEERARVKSNGEEASKPKYVSTLEAIIRILSALLK